MAGPFDALFEALMNAAERVDELFQRRRSKLGLLALLAAALLVYATVPGPLEPESPWPEENATGVGLSPSLSWIGGGQRAPVLSSAGLDPNSKISYQVLLGAEGEDLHVVGTTRGGGGTEPIFINTTTPLAAGTVYRWQVVAENSLKKRARGEVWTFSTGALPEIVGFKADRSVVNLGEAVTLRWSVANAREAEIEPGAGAVPLQGEMRLDPEENVTYTLIARNFAGVSRASVDVAVLKPLVIDSMAGGWSSIEDGRGSVVRDINAVLGVEDNATKISYDLTIGGWVGITKTFSRNGDSGSLSLAGTDGISFFSRGGGVPSDIEIRLMYANGSIYGRAWKDGAVSSDWTRMEAGYQEFECIKADGSGCMDAALDVANVTAVYFVISDGDGDSRESGRSGWIAIDDLEAFHRRNGESRG